MNTLLSAIFKIKCENLFSSEIQSMKSNKVKLMRQIKEENAKFLTWKKEKEREVKQLKEKVSSNFKTFCRK